MLEGKGKSEGGQAIGRAKRTSLGMEATVSIPRTPGQPKRVSGKKAKLSFSSKALSFRGPIIHLRMQFIVPSSTFATFGTLQDAQIGFNSTTKRNGVSSMEQTLPAYIYEIAATYAAMSERPRSSLV